MGQADPNKEILARLDELHEMYGEMLGEVKRIGAGFPEGDVEGHRRFHEELMRSYAERRKLRQELIAHLIKSSSWAALAGCALVLWNHFFQR